MAYGARAENAFAKVKGKSKTQEIISKLLPKPKPESLAVTRLVTMLDTFAQKEGGEFEPEDLSVSFGDDDTMIIVYGSLDRLDASHFQDIFYFQAMLRTSSPTKFIVGELRDTPTEAMISLYDSFGK